MWDLFFLGEWWWRVGHRGELPCLGPGIRRGEPWGLSLAAAAIQSRQEQCGTGWLGVVPGFLDSRPWTWCKFDGGTPLYTLLPPAGKWQCYTNLVSLTTNTSV